MRFSDPEQKFNQICKLIKHAEEQGWSIVACSHKEMDREIERFLLKNNINFEVKNLTTSSPREIMEHYAQVDLSVGMRGHSQMIPFGFNKPIVSLISHDKLQFFLDDLGLNEYGINLNSDDIDDKFNKILSKIQKDRSALIETLRSKQEFVWAETLENFAVMYDSIK